MSTTLGLCIITNNDPNLRSCLLSAFGSDNKLFDQITVVNCATKNKDKDEVNIILNSLPVKAYEFEWCDDFSKARNFSFDKTQTDYRMWIDSDDLITEDNYKKLVDLKPQLTKHNMWILNYDYGHDSNGNVTTKLKRERIVQNHPALRWKGRIHEAITMTPNCNFVDISIKHTRKHATTSLRNLEMLRLEYEQPHTSRTDYYYGRELADFGEWEQALPILNSFINNPECFYLDKIMACHKISDYYNTKKDYKQAKILALRGLEIDKNSGELLCDLGQATEGLGDYSCAELCYRLAMSCSQDSMGTTYSAWYNQIPRSKLQALEAKLKQH